MYMQISKSVNVITMMKVLTLFAFRLLRQKYLWILKIYPVEKTVVGEMRIIGDVICPELELPVNPSSAKQKLQQTTF